MHPVLKNTGIFIYTSRGAENYSIAHQGKQETVLQYKAAPRHYILFRECIMRFCSGIITDPFRRGIQRESIRLPG